MLKEALETRAFLSFGNDLFLAVAQTRKGAYDPTRRELAPDRRREYDGRPNEPHIPGQHCTLVELRKGLSADDSVFRSDRRPSSGYHGSDLQLNAPADAIHAIGGRSKLELPGSA